MKTTIEFALKILILNKDARVAKVTKNNAYRKIGELLADGDNEFARTTYEEWNDKTNEYAHEFEKLHLKAKCWDKHEEDKELAYKQRWADKK